MFNESDEFLITIAACMIVFMHFFLTIKLRRKFGEFKGAMLSLLVTGIAVTITVLLSTFQWDEALAWGTLAILMLLIAELLTIVEIHIWKSRDKNPKSRR